MTDSIYYVNQIIQDLSNIECAENSLSELKDIQNKWQVLKATLEDDENLMKSGY